MTYKHLIEIQKDEKTFKEKVKPFLNKGEHYFKILLMADSFTYECVVGYAYRCTREDLYKDLNKWAEEEVEGFATFMIFEKAVDTDGHTYAIDSFKY